MLELNKVYNMDCIEGMKLIDDKSIDLIILDPPYLTTNELWDKKEIVNEKLSEELLRIAKDNCSIYIWCGIGEKSQSLIRWFPIFSKRFYFKDLITWKKQRGVGMRHGWLYTREEIMWFVKDNNKFIWNEKYQYSDEKRQHYGFKKNGINIDNLCKSDLKRLTNVWTDIKETTFNGTFGKQKYLLDNHFTPKPLETIKRIINVHTKENSIIFDPFMGSGTTMIAALETNRNFIGFEIDKKYFDGANKRIEDWRNQMRF